MSKNSREAAESAKGAIFPAGYFVMGMGVS